MKFLVIAFKDIKEHLKGPKFYFSLFLSSLAIIGLRVLFDIMRIPAVAINAIFLINLIFTLSLPFIGLALLLLNADALTKERSEGTILILFYLPISDTSIILGKFITIFLSGILYTFVNVLLLRILHPYIFEATGFVTENQLIFSFFLAELLFLLPIIGLTLIFSLIFRRSATVIIMIILVYEVLAVLYSSQLVLTLPTPFVIGRELVQIFVILMGSVLGYMMYTAGLLIPVSGLVIEEPPIIKYLPINVNAQRVFYFLTSPSPRIQTLEVAISIFWLLLITIVLIFISLVLIKKARSEYLE
jgi:ABC-type transport system involved in multi-copper enzyme maturation permease subunit